MTPAVRITTVDRAGRTLIEGFEGLRLRAYPDPATRGEPWTIGYGHTSAAGLPYVSPGLVITATQADDILSRDLAQFERAVSADVGKTILTQGQFNACVSLAYNIGAGGFVRSSVGERLRAGDYSGAAATFLLYVKAGGRFNQGLSNRRHAEVAAFNGASVKHIRRLVAYHEDSGAEMVRPDAMAA